MGNILVLDDEESLRFTFEHFLRDAGHEVLCAGTYDEAVARVSQTEFDVIISDIILGGKSGVDFLRECRKRNLSCPVIMITGYPAIQTAADVVRLGAFDYLPKPIEPETLLHVTELALQHKRVTDENEDSRSRLDTIFSSVEYSIITVSKDLVVTELNQAAKTLCGFDHEVVGKDLRSLEFGCKGRCLRALEKTSAKRQPVRAQRFECRQENNPTKSMNLSTYPLTDRRGSFTGAAMVCRDETRIAAYEGNVGERRSLHNMVGKSGQMQRIYSLLEVLANVGSSVLISGESGTGKELVAEALHYLGMRKNRPLVKVNCSALSESLLESELFGHVRGAFTGAIHDKVGRFQKADGGTIFLDEIGDLSPKVQVTLLRVLEGKQIERVGDSTPVRIDARVITATNKNLEEKVKLGEFRADLLFRLRVVEVALPPLRERLEDIPLLVEHFVKELNRKMNMAINGVSPDVEGILLTYPWPGNIRELQYALEHAFVLCQEGTITVEHLPPYIRSVSPSHAYSFGKTQSAKPQAIIEALEKTAWNKKGAARLLGIDRKTLYRSIAKYNIAAVRKG